MKLLSSVTLTLLLSCLLFNVNAQSSKSGNALGSVAPTEKAGGANMEFETEVIDYGTIEHNADGHREFKFTNTGTEPLVIQNAKGSCGCTVPTWPREPIAPGESNVIKVKYATNRVGSFQKTVTLTTNVEGKPKVLTIKGKVLPDPAPSNGTGNAPSGH